MALDPQTQALLAHMVDSGMPEFDQLTVDEARQLYLGMNDLAGPPEPVAKVDDRAIPGPGGSIPVRVYTPEASGPLPILVFYHGGGWTLGTLDTMDGPCRALANAAGCVIVSVDYRLAPEHKFPAAADDCYAAARYVAENAASFQGDARRLAVGGDSAGGNLAAVVALMARDRGGPEIAFQLLIYPVTDHACDTRSYEENAAGYLLTKSAMAQFWANYLNGPEDGKNPYASPLRAESLSGLPPALVLTAGHDPLRDEGEAYAQRLRASGVAAEVKRYDGCIHGFFQMGAMVDSGKQAIAASAAALRAAFAR